VSIVRSALKASNATGVSGDWRLEIVHSICHLDLSEPLPNPLVATRRSTTSLASQASPRSASSGVRRKNLAGHTGCCALATGANPRWQHGRRELDMNKDQVKGVAEKVKGKVNETVGRATGDKGQELKGDLQQGAGEMRKSYGDAKEEAKDNAKRNAP
jgi:uncharacterized protein YjbJ (UPF0337 family)